MFIRSKNPSYGSVSTQSPCVGTVRETEKAGEIIIINKIDLKQTHTHTFKHAVTSSIVINARMCVIRLNQFGNKFVAINKKTLH